MIEAPNEYRNAAYCRTITSAHAFEARLGTYVTISQAQGVLMEVCTWTDVEALAAMRTCAGQNRSTVIDVAMLVIATRDLPGYSHPA